MTDVVERLREKDEWIGGWNNEAADEIARLRKEILHWHRQWEKATSTGDEFPNDYKTDLRLGR